MRVLSCLAGCAPTLLALTCISTVHASPLFELVGGGFGSGGLNARSTGASSSSTYFNPALLPQAKQGLELGMFFVSDNLSIELDPRGNSYDVPLSAANRFATDNPSVPTDWLELGCDPAQAQGCVTKLAPSRRGQQGTGGTLNLYQTVGLISQIWQEHLVLGLYAMIPYGSFTQAHSFFVDEREQFFTNSLHSEMYGDRLTPVSLAFGAGSRLTDWLSLGLTFTLSLSNEADAVAYVGNSAKIEETLQLSTRVDVAASVSPHFAVLVEPLEALDLTATVHTPQKMEINTAFSTYLPNGDLQRAVRPATHAWMPWTIALGASYDVIKAKRNRMAVVATATYERWSEYLNRQTERPLRDYEWSDVFTGALGLRYIRDEQLTLFADAAFHPTPVPAQTGRTNYVDNDRQSLSAGFNYDRPVERWKMIFRFGAQLQAHILPERHQTKFNPKSAEFGGNSYSQLVLDEWPDGTIDVATGEEILEARGLQTNNPGFPGFSSGGTLFGGGVNLSLLY